MTTNIDTSQPDKTRVHGINVFCSAEQGCRLKLRTQTSMGKAMGISRQAVSRLIQNRERTGIPLHEDEAGRYAVCDELVQWRKTFKQRRGPRPKKS